MVVKISEHLRD